MAGGVRGGPGRMVENWSGATLIFRTLYRSSHECQDIVSPVSPAMPQCAAAKRIMMLKFIVYYSSSYKCAIVQDKNDASERDNVSPLIRVYVGYMRMLLLYNDCSD